MSPKHLLLLACFPLATGCFGAIASEAEPAPANAPPPTEKTAPAVFQANGTLERPAGYRSWIYAGTPLTPNDMNSGKAAFPEFHSVYVDPASFEAYKTTGEWRDGTVVVKELISVGTKSAASGKGYFMGEFQGLEAMVKSKDRFPDEPGHWGFFRFTDEKGGAVHRTATAQLTASCASCHAPSADHDLVFTQHYPVLRAARSAGVGNPEDR